ncbi:hypothetical protein PACTADRAFT_39683 [Pachysolen tannophilus NRRL Y-2460]|uniref:Dipeptidyl peptidase 3 n=1 Tax=Pachysolen tannophilus NRRL Y-2460 TaxID=669874 RepID=A0A1E4TZ49_PACTA|nr:hypothetical protein PACTADRAFT_39683 [Pachysolen tannophilus NRRL Y-2460]
MSCGSSTIQTAEYFADTKAPVISLSAKHHFDQLTLDEKKYAHYMSKGSHWGTRAVLRSVSPESEAIFDLIISIHKQVNGNYEKFFDSKLSSESVKAYLEYGSMFLSNLGNYKSFGDVKFIPRLTVEEFDTLIETIGNPDISKLYQSVKTALYALDGKNILLGWRDKGHVSGYYLDVVSKDEAEAVNAALSNEKIMPENTRVGKISDDEFVVYVASASLKNETTYYPDEIPFKLHNGKAAKLIIKFGDHSKEFVKIAENLSNAKKHAANDIQARMLSHYIESFQTGSMNAHKESQKEWVKDYGPSVETNIGFIETYRDPAGVRGEWEGLVAMVNKERTAKFQTLVQNAPKYIKELPWSAEFEKEKFTAPDFTSLEVLTFAGSGIPAGINIPNYDDVRMTIGFKNVSLGNILSAKSSKKPVTFIEDSLQQTFDEYTTQAFEVQVGAHELLGHGTGLLLSELQDGSFNFDVKNPPLGLDGKPIKTFYKKGETWGSVFSSISGSMEECRAELVGLYLQLFPDFLEIFGFSKKEIQDKIVLTSFLTMARAGLIGIEYWEPNTGKWGQAHMQARYSIFKTMLEAGLVKLEYSKPDYSDLLVKLDPTLIHTVGKKCIGDYLLKLHVYKCSADVVNGTKFYTEKTTVTPDIAKFREIIISKRMPRKQFIQANSFIEDDEVKLKEYEESEIGMIQSFVDREV